MVSNLTSETTEAHETNLTAWKYNHDSQLLHYTTVYGAKLVSKPLPAILMTVTSRVNESHPFAKKRNGYRAVIVYPLCTGAIASRRPPHPLANKSRTTSPQPHSSSVDCLFIIYHFNQNHTVCLTVPQGPGQ
jgi:hypothetical protein